MISTQNLQLQELLFYVSATLIHVHYMFQYRLIKHIHLQMEGYICIKTNFFDKVKYPFSIVKQENLVHLYFIISAKTGAKTNSF